MYWGTSWKENSYLNIVLWLEESMGVQWISRSVRTGRINEVCGNPPQKIGGMGIGPTAHDWLMRCAYDFQPEFENAN
jgi:hypothetical protein